MKKRLWCGVMALVVGASGFVGGLAVGQRQGQPAGLATAEAEAKAARMEATAAREEADRRGAALDNTLRQLGEVESLLDQRERRRLPKQPD